MASLQALTILKKFKRQVQTSVHIQKVETQVLGTCPREKLHQEFTRGLIPVIRALKGICFSQGLFLYCVYKLFEGLVAGTSQTPGTCPLVSVNLKQECKRFYT